MASPLDGVATDGLSDLASSFYGVASDRVSLHESPYRTHSNGMYYCTACRLKDVQFILQKALVDLSEGWVGSFFWRCYRWAYHHHLPMYLEWNQDLLIFVHFLELASSNTTGCIFQKTNILFTILMNVPIMLKKRRSTSLWQKLSRMLPLTEDPY